MRKSERLSGAEVRDGTLARAGEEKGEVLRHLTPYGLLILDRQRNLVQSPLRPGVNIKLFHGLGSILAKLLEDPEAYVGETELRKIQYPQNTTFTSWDHGAIRTAISRLRLKLGDIDEPHKKKARKNWRLIFSFHSGDGQTYYSLIPWLPNARPGEQEADTQRYIYQHEIPSVGKLVLDANREIVHSPLKPGQNIVLGQLETRLLAVLMSDPERVFSRQTLVQKIWNDPSSDPKKLRALIYRLRLKLGSDHPFDLIHYFRGFGYSLTGLKDANVGDT